jgi:glycolate oxidase
MDESLPDVVLFPSSTDEISEVMKVADREGIPVTARGSGTNLAGESVPVRGGIVLCLTRMDKILAIDKQNRLATVQPGVINLELQKAVEKEGLMYPPDPASWAVATLGGTVSTNAGGPRTLRYGVTKDYLHRLTVVLANGDVLDTGQNTFKTYDLTRLMCGSEGTLGIITEITVRLIPLARASRTLRADFKKLDDCSDAVAAIIASGIVPAALELIDHVVIRTVEEAFKLGLPQDLEGILLIQVDGYPESLANQVTKIQEILKEKGAATVIVAKDAAEAERLWFARRAAAPALMRMRPNTVTEDVTVPVSHLTAMIKKVREISDRHRIPVGVLAHAGDGNLHPCMLFDKRDDDEWARVRAVCEDIVPEALALGGTLSGEHGIGLAKSPFLQMELNAATCEVTRKIKEAFDPKGILNPGKFV